MRVDHVNDRVDLCVEGGWKGWRSRLTPASGLSVTITATGKVKVTTGGPLAKRFLPKGNAPLELDMTVELYDTGSGLDVTWDNPAITFAFGDRSVPVPEEVIEATLDIVEQFVVDVSTAGDFCTELARIRARAAQATAAAAEQEAQNRRAVSANILSISADLETWSKAVSAGEEPPCALHDIFFQFEGVLRAHLA